MFAHHVRFTFFCSIRIAALALFGVIALAVFGAGAADASTACKSSHSTTKWKHGSVSVYAKHLKRGIAGHKYVENVYTACSTKYRRKIVLEPDAYSGFTSFVEFRTNGRYLYYTVHLEGPVDGAANIGREVDLKSGHTTRKLLAPKVEGESSVPCVGFEGGCLASVVSSAITTHGPGFAVATNVDGGSAEQPVAYHRIAIFCPNQSVTAWTAKEVEFGVGVLGRKTLHTDGAELKWKIFGVRGSAPFCA